MTDSTLYCEPLVRTEYKVIPKTRANSLLYIPSSPFHSVVGAEARSKPRLIKYVKTIQHVNVHFHLFEKIRKNSPPLSCLVGKKLSEDS